MKIIIPGGTGQVGRILVPALQARGHEVVVLSRKPGKAPWKIVRWDAQTLGDWLFELEGADAIINLTGKSVNCRYTWKNRWKILESRVRSIRVLGEACRRVSSPPKIWLQASTATIYQDTYGTPNDEHHGVIGGLEPEVPETWRFSIDVARAWEGEFGLLELPGVRKVLLRSAMTMSPTAGSVFHYLLRLVRFGFGGKIGSGGQYVSWIHYQDFINAICFLLERDDITGPVNLTAPHPLPNTDFMEELRKAWGTRVGLATPVALLELGAVFLRTESELVLKSRRVVPARLLDLGFKFQFPAWGEAARNLCGEWKKDSAINGSSHPVQQEFHPVPGR